MCALLYCRVLSTTIKQKVKWVGCGISVKAIIYEKMNNEFHVYIKGVKQLAVTPDTRLVSKKYGLITSHITWWKYNSWDPWVNNKNQIRAVLSAKMMLIRDFGSIIPIDVWYYVVDLMIESEKTREVVFV
jgi:hypothetical protein